MNTKVRTSLQAMKAPPKSEEQMVTETGGGKPGRERKIQLQKTVEKLRKKLRTEENINRALQRAFTRPVGSLPRLPPYLPSQMVELLAEVAVLEEEVITLEGQVIDLRQALYQEAILSSSLHHKPAAKALPPPASPNPKRKKSKSMPPIPRARQKTEKERESNSPNAISEELLRCLIEIFFGGGRAENSREPSISGEDDGIFHDPYGIFNEFKRRDVGPYKRFSSFDASITVISTPPQLLRKLRLLLTKLRSVDLRGLTHQAKLAFWVNVYNACMMNALLENGIPSTPQLVASLMQKAKINVGGQLMSAVSIEHFVLRSPGSRPSSSGGLDWPEPLVTFALSCGSWSSPALRIYTAAKVEEELETAKREYLQAAVGISAATEDGGSVGVPKLLHWYLVEFAKDVDSLLDWICLQLPRGIRNEAVNCLETGRAGQRPVDFVKILPYDFTFRYLLASGINY